MKKHIKSVVSGFLVMTLCLGSLQVVNATTIDEAQKKAEALESEKDAAQAQQSALNAELNQIIGEMEETSNNLEKKAEEIEVTEEELVQAKVEENTQYQSMKKRIKYMYEHGDTSYIEILMACESITDFLNKADYIKQLSEYDRKMLDEFQAIVEEVEEKEAQLNAEYEELSALQDELIAKQENVESLLAKNQLQIADLEQQIGANAKVLQDLIAQAEEEKRIREERAAAEAAAKKQQQAASSNNSSSSSSSAGSSSGSTSSGSTSSGSTSSGSTSSGSTSSGSTSSGSTSSGSTSSGSTSSGSSSSASGIFSNPCPGASYISSTFGYREWDNSFHKGLDYAAPAGTPTYAADGGRVVTAGYSSSAGNWVVIDHQNGFVTKYMHHTTIYVSAGQYVSKGQQIGAVGSTGYSSGNHLHFQIELNGVAVNPQLYL